MWVKIAVFFAEVLIQYFLNSEVALKKTLQEAVDRNKQYQLNYDKLLIQQRQAEVDISNKQKVVDDLKVQLNTIHSNILELEKEKNDKLQEITNTLDNTPDSVVISKPLV